ncbi:MAG: LysM peptidoglycan-binding domain-containing protein, partial [Candidatus Obscuribacterales bacterium]|nr:LysM peptidoglycan-binding domain-containing protein [Candidatus Obscuribacterales bacterium]
MSDQEKAVEKPSSTSDKASSVAETVVKEASAGKEELLNVMKKASDFLKAGGTSGISGWFGKPDLGDLEKAYKPEAKAQIYRSEASPFKADAKSETQVQAPATDSGSGKAQAVEQYESKPGQAANTDGDKSKGEALKARGGDHVVKMPAEKITVNPDNIYAGEGIKRDLEPAQHTVAKGETIQDIAKAHLGPGASEEEIAKHVKEIERANHL